MKDACRYSIIIPFHGNEIYLRFCLATLEPTIPRDVEIIVVTNSDFEMSWMGKHVHLLRVDEVLTYPQSINHGASNAKGEFFIFCDADTAYVAGWFENLTSFYHSDRSVGIASSKLVNPYSGRIADFGIGFTQYNSPHIGQDRPFDFKLFQTNRKVQSACSANMIISRALFSELGGFDESLAYSYCDVDLCLRIKELGKEIWVVADSIVFHKGNSSNTNSSMYKADVKGRFWSINGPRVTLDMESYFIEAMHFFTDIYGNTEPSYLLVDLSTVLDRDWHYLLFKNSLNLNIVDRHMSPAKERDASIVPLYDLLSWNILKLRFPIIYFVDRFISIDNNALWWRIRESEHDLVIDRNGNIDKVKAILTNDF